MEAKTAEHRAAFEETARTYARSLAARGAGACVVALHGELGAGKTTFVQYVADELGITAAVTSPTFVIQKTYPISDGTHGFHTLVHIDAYRLAGAADLAVLDWEETIADPGNLICIEWAARVESALPPQTKHLYFSCKREGVHTITYGSREA